MEQPSLEERLRQEMLDMVARRETFLTLAETRQQFDLYMTAWKDGINGYKQGSSTLREIGMDGIYEDFELAKQFLKIGRYIDALTTLEILLGRPFPGESGYEQTYRNEGRKMDFTTSSEGNKGVIEKFVVDVVLATHNSQRPSRKTVRQLYDELSGLDIKDAAIYQLHIFDSEPPIDLPSGILGRIEESYIRDILGRIAEHYVQTQLSCKHLSGVYSCEQPVTLSSTPRLDKMNSKLSYLFRIEGSCPETEHEFEGLIDMGLGHVNGYEPISVPGERPT